MINFYRVTFQRTDTAVTGSHDMTQDFVERVHRGDWVSAWLDSAGEFLLHNSRPLNCERVCDQWSDL